MNEKKAKALRKSVRFHPAAPREYQSDRPHMKPLMVSGVMRMVTVPGTLLATGPRRRYQDAKRSQA